MPIDFVLEPDSAEWDFFPLDTHPKDRPGKNSYPFIIVVVMEESSEGLFIHQDPTDGVSELLYSDEEPASTGLFKALS